ncbi:UDP-N-acetylmuramoyl-tripeptide--D-alanyl-D-alanine ligase [Sphingobacterium sp. FBM7-1]|uniref:UDP-N-acetylmuramoyl-tripeptide--D-alanyl-D- alanine ligase n=1 Tax=Sphingobacterium sp. FBM7-1 TaxID=2886688 RepID=UPI001D10449B|nr:UDP-N-acetylmuramoyl-tripeptide--D-alanyl-D-alanine ligase [Sphingobacterium sp. FBM7-1]MCC2599897.1 UDP-N-acetylmuramoyl-tripeptide--D-alanyl-D-alanine ligase [Sphingobacterium sp. FBM7-1]
MNSITTEQLYQLYKACSAISTDTRNIPPSSIFFALKGDRFNANTFAARALESGAKWAVVDDEAYATDERFILVDDVLTTLQALARYHRQQLDIPVIGITGTNGKTTTKELLHAVLSQRFRTYATPGNLNNHIGVPLSLLAIDDGIEVAVIEMGANHQEEIAFLCSITAPTHGLITNVGKAHLEGFGSFDGVKKAKGELYDFLKMHDGVLFLQGDNKYLREMEMQRGISKIVRYGFSPANDIVGRLEYANPLLCVSWKIRDAEVYQTVETQLTGSYNTENILAAIAVGHFFGIDDVHINQGIVTYTPTNNRSQITKTGQNVVIADYYNANVSSMEAALANLEVIEAEHKVIVLGDMFELGDDAAKEHRYVVDKALAIDADRTIFVGEAFYAHQNTKAEFYETTDNAKEALREHPVVNSTILLKASRGMAFEKLMEIL